jgi:hypothetical protein
MMSVSSAGNAAKGKYRTAVISAILVTVKCSASSSRSLGDAGLSMSAAKSSVKARKITAIAASKYSALSMR